MENSGIDLLEKLKQADMVLVGIGEDFNGVGGLREDTVFQEGKALLKEAGYHWLVPMWQEYCCARKGGREIEEALQKLAGLLEGKNYFVVSVSTNSVLARIPWKEGRLVMPCGSCLKKQCVKGCEEQLSELTPEDKAALEAAFAELAEGHFPKDGIPELGRCAKCGGEMVLNNIYAEGYAEEAYMEQWKLYTKWLQSTLNRRLLLLELGVSMQFPTVIRWPFEKVAFYNNKAFFCRVNEKLYQMTAELSEKGVGIPQNAIAWISNL